MIEIIFLDSWSLKIILSPTFFLGEKVKFEVCENRHKKRKLFLKRGALPTGAFHEGIFLSGWRKQGNAFPMLLGRADLVLQIFFSWYKNNF
jgi:hypothetical protein